jgi:hypothetical protein
MKMRLLIFFLTVVFFTLQLYSQPPINITDGYIGNPIYALDSGYLFARSLANDEIFYRWDLQSASKIEILDAEFESTLWFRMTQFPVTAKANFRYLSKPLSLQNFEVQGGNFSKRIFYAKADNAKGTVFLFHTEATSSVEWTQNYYEQFQLFKMLQFYGYSVILFDCEERATSTDINNDKVVNWQLVPHSIEGNNDYKNCELIIAELKNRNIISENENIYAIGNSNGGLFAQGFADLFAAKACVVFNAQPNIHISADKQTTPIMFNVNVNDISVNSSINQLFVDSLKNVSKCASIHYTRATPLYPEAFARTRMIPMDLSIKLFDELKANDYLTNFNYLNKSFLELITDVVNNPSKWPEARFLNSSYSTAYSRQIRLSNAEKEFNSNRVSAVVEFFEFPCEVNTSVKENQSKQSQNTFTTNSYRFVSIPIEKKFKTSLTIFTITGFPIEIPFEINENTILLNFTNIPIGVYFVRLERDNIFTILNCK